MQLKVRMLLNKFLLNVVSVTERNIKQKGNTVK